ncbi:DUF4271 domain-containing protein [Lewinella sp. IMCC34183]|uniref:DUF4271 domain-containing protein n=1 Tax=Lewinella sp. IMCC34183 TaxID=2248762 RepID=UPI000E285437|nr:DUF4271 domain-containing protein [Lewinella sp. IMCC34183]
MRHFLLLCCLLVTVAGLPAQAGEPTVPVAREQAGDTSQNPFDLYPTRPEPERFRPVPVDPTVPPPTGSESVVFIHLLLLLMLASLWVLFRNLLVQCFTATLNDNMMTQLYRRRSGGQISALWLCYLLFLLSAGFYLYLFAIYYGLAFPGGVWLGWLVSALVVASVVGLKFFVLLLLGRVFPLRRELSRYTFVLMVFSILSGIVLVPLNLLVSYAPEAYRSFFLLAGAAVLVLIYLVHLVRGLFIANHYVGSRPLHFFLYICTIEIAPLLVVYRYLSHTLT